MSSEECQIAEVQSRCRICMAEKSSQISLFEYDRFNKIQEVASVQVAIGDGLPSTICIDCEVNLEKCYEFRAQVQNADKKFREEISMSQILIECNVKEEGRFELEDDNEENDDSYYGHDNDDSPEASHDGSIAEQRDNNHEDIVDNGRNAGVEVPNDPSEQEDPLIEMGTQLEQSEDPLTSMKVEQFEPMETDSNVAGPSTATAAATTSTSNVRKTKVASIIEGLPNMFNSPTSKPEKQKEQLLLAEHFLLCEEQALSHSVVPGSKFAPEGLTTKNIKKPSNYMSKLVTPGSIENDDIINQTTSQNILLATPVQISPNPFLLVFGSRLPSFNSDVPSSSFEPNGESVPAISENPNAVSKHPKLCSASSPNVYAELVEIEKGSKRENEQTLTEPFCSICDKKFFDVDGLKDHLENKKLTCRVCCKDFYSHSELEKHFVAHRMVKCKICLKKFYCKRDLFKHRESTPCGSKTACQLCDKKFLSKRSLQRHIKTFHRESSKRYSCLVCGKQLSSKDIFMRHMRFTHPAYENVECRFCEAIFWGPEKLTIHIKANHIETDERVSHSCSKCGKIFSNVRQLQNHNKYHDETEILCQICGKSVIGKLNMKNHVRREHKNSGSFWCELCNLQFNTEYKLKDHFRSSSKHTPRKIVYCEICGKGISGNINSHLRIHSGEKPFVCKVCGASFTQNTTLALHSRTHSNDKKYHCSICGEGFKWKQTFTNHLKKCSEAGTEQRS